MATYDLAPEMKAEAIGDTIVKAIEDTAFDLVVANFANADMVGHSGKLEPTIRASKRWMRSLGRIYKAIREKNGSWLITADHGNAEMMVDPVTGGPHTAHTTNPVPIFYVSEDASHFRLRPDGSLRDISPTLLSLLEAGTAKRDDRRRSARSDHQMTKSARTHGVSASSHCFISSGLRYLAWLENMQLQVPPLVATATRSK